MERFLFKTLFHFDEGTKIVSATLVPSFEGEALSKDHLWELMALEGYQDYFPHNEAIDELLLLDQTLREKGQKVLELNLKRSEESNAPAKELDDAESLAVKPEDVSTTDPDSREDTRTELGDENERKGVANGAVLNAHEQHDATVGESAPGEEDTLSPLTAEQIFAMLDNETLSADIAECRDGTLEITTSEDDMLALLSITKPFGGESLDMTRVKFEADKAGIMAKLDEAAIENTLELENGEPSVFAKGTTPERGENSTFTALVSDQLSTGPKIDDKGNVNYHDINQFIVVDEGEPLMRRTDPTPGKNGLDVYGKVIPAETGEILPFFNGIEGAKVSEEDPSLLISTIKGHPIIFDQGVSIDTVLMLDNASIVTGNVDFDGSICVQNDVADGITIKASGDVTVLGVVGKAEIEAGGDVKIAKGLIGGSNVNDDEHKDGWFGASVLSGGSVSAKYASYARITANKQISVEEYASHCDLRAEQKILIGYPSGKGNLIGGNTRAFELVSAKILGSLGGAQTGIRVGADADTIIDMRRIVQAKQQKQALVQEMSESLNRMGIQAKEVGLNAQTKELMNQLNNQMHVIDAEIQEHHKEESVFKHALLRTKRSRVKATNKIYHSVSVSILSSTYRVKEEQGGGQFRFEARNVLLEC